MDKVFEAIRREREHQDKAWGPIETKNFSIDAWSSFAENSVISARHHLLTTKGDHDMVKLRLLQAAATIVACLQRLGVVERKCEHEWRMSDTAHDYRKRIILVYCSNCHAEGHIRNPSTHEYREAQSGEGLRWYEPDRVIIQGRK